MSIRSQLSDVRETLPEGVTLVAVSKTHAPALIEEAYAAGQRIFGESRPQELAAKYEALPKDIEWHMIGHLQTNKVKLIAPFVALIHSADSERLIRVINDEAIRNGRVIDILLEIHVADEETKSGWTYDALLKYVKSGALAAMKGVRVRGVMGIATYTSNDLPSSYTFTYRLSEISRYLNLIRNEKELPDNLTVPNLSSPDFIPLA